MLLLQEVGELPPKLLEAHVAMPQLGQAEPDLGGKIVIGFTHDPARGFGNHIGESMLVDVADHERGQRLPHIHATHSTRGTIERDSGITPAALP